jgi:beta-lactamase regulating signal transducer with metallopeptidase domain
MSAVTIASWLLTYLVHSTVLLGAAWLVSRHLGDRRLALQETLLRTALIGGLLTTTLQIGFGVEPVGGALAIADFSQPEVVAAGGNATTSVVAGDSLFSATPTIHSQTLDSWPVALLSLWGLGSLLAMLVLGRSVLDLRRLLKTRRFRPAGPLLDRLAASMGLRKSVRLSTSAAIAVPFATGIRHPEICCPERVADLASEHRKSLFAHELAHLARRDPAWQLLYRLGEAILFLQPLNRFVSRRLEEIAEHLTDERAVACTGDRLGLARCLVVVAHWGLSDAPGIPATAFAAGPRLDRRVRHLISGTIGQHRNTRWTAPVLTALVVGSVVLLPAVAPSSLHADNSPTGPGAAPIQMWSITSADDPEAEIPAPLAVPASSDTPRPVAPVTDAAPAPEAIPRPPAEPRAVPVPELSAKPTPVAAPESKAGSVPPAPPAAPEPPAKTEKKAAEEASHSQRERAREEARDRQLESERERSAAEMRAREQTRALDAEGRALIDQTRELARESAERLRLGDDERERLRNEARELMRQAENEACEHSMPAVERLRLGDAEREEMRRRAEMLREEARKQVRETARAAREQARELAEQARGLADDAEAKRQMEEKLHRRERHD